MLEGDRNEFKAELFQQAFIDNLQDLHGKTPQTATPQECYGALASMVRGRLLQSLTPEIVVAETGTRIVAEVSLDWAIDSLLKTSLANLGLMDAIRQALQVLEINLDDLFQQETNQNISMEALGDLVSSYLEALATANTPAIGYGISYDSSETFSLASNSVESDSETNSETETSWLNDPPWQVERPEAMVEVKFGGYTQSYADERGYHVRWFAEDVVEAVPYDVPIAGYQTEVSSLLRLWKIDGTSKLASPLSQRFDRTHPQEENFLKQAYFLVSCLVQDIIRLHLQSNQSVETLDRQFIIHLHEDALVLAIAELMHQLVDEHYLVWDQAWSITETVFSFTFHQVSADEVGNWWTIELISRVLPRHLEIIYEINRRFLDQVRSYFTTDSDLDIDDRIRRMSAIDETGERSLQMMQMAWMGSHTLIGVSNRQTHLLQTLLPDFNELQPQKLMTQVNGVNARRWLLQTNPDLASVLTAGLGESWIVQPEELEKLRELVNDVQFCANWWQVKREAKQSLVNWVKQKVAITINLNSLFDVQVITDYANDRPLLNLLHVITLFARLKINASSDTIQRFAHRSVPRTFIFVVTNPGNNAIASLSLQLIKSVATVVNNDPDIQGRLQVVWLERDQHDQVSPIYAATDLSEQILLANQDSLNPNVLRFALNGAMTIATPHHINLELWQTMGAKNIFLFGLTATEIHQFQTGRCQPQNYYDNNAELRQAIDLIASGYFSYGDRDAFRQLIDWLLVSDPTCILADYAAYINTQERVSQAYQDQKNWTWMSILATASISRFCTDRTVAAYQNIWKMESSVETT